MATIRKRLNQSTGNSKRDFEDLFVTAYRLGADQYAGAVQRKNEGDKELMMTLANGDVNQYNEIKSLNVQDYLLKYESFIKDLQARKK